MAYVEKYKVEYQDLRLTQWKASILENDYSGSVTALKGTGNPLRLRVNSSNDIYNDPVRTTEVTIEIWVENDFFLNELYAVEDMHYKVEIYCGATLLWQGWLRSSEISESYDMTPYTMQLTAVCGLKYLGNMKYLDGDGAKIWGRYSDSWYILDLLSRIGYTEFEEYVNLYETNINSGTGDSAYDQIYVDAEAFDGRNCDEVLRELLAKYNAVIMQVNGVFCIYRPGELSQSTVYGRHFTGATTKSSVSLSPAYYLKRSGYSSDIRQMPGGVANTQKPASNLIVNHDYGYKESWIRNYNFSSETIKLVDGNYLFDQWQRNIGGAFFLPVSIFLKSEKEGLAFTTYVVGGTSYNSYISQTFATYSRVSSNPLAFEFDYCCISNISFNNAKFYIEIKADNAYKWLTNDTNIALKWNVSSAKIEILHNVVAGDASWRNVRYTVPSLPSAGSYTIKIFVMTQNTNYYYLGIKNIRFIQTADSLFTGRTKSYTWGFGWMKRWKKYFKYNDNAEIITKKYVIDNGIIGSDEEYNYLLGDVVDTNVENTIEQFKGALNYINVIQQIDYLEPMVEYDIGTINVTSGSVTRIMYWDIDQEHTCQEFVASYASDYLADGIVIDVGTDSGLYYVKFMASKVINTSWTPRTGSMYAAITNVQNYSLAYIPTSVWATRGGSENKTLLELIAGEIAYQSSRPKQMLSLPVADMKSDGFGLKMLGCMTDVLNEYDSAPRKFVMLAGELDLFNRIYDIDYIELIN